MPRALSLTLTSLLAGVLLGVTLFLAFRPSPAPSAPPAAAVARSASAPAPSTPESAPTAPGSAMSLDQAMRQLDLIRPARRKLAEDFGLPTVDGATFRLSEHRGRLVFINFWATWCPPCREEMPSMERLWRQSRARAFTMVAVSVDTDPKVVPPFLAAHDLTFPVVLDTTMDVAQAYGVRGIPTTFLVDREGHLLAIAMGPRQWDGEAARALVGDLGR